ncbi:MAG: hypothetical protein LUI09_07130 [Prevotellaceae bacterium]|nr:hypothetical protein [Prevotellaceae bacterium]
MGKGSFGDIYDQFKGRVKEAIDFLLSHKSGDLLGVFHRDEIGDIDLVWGNDKGGLCHIITKHVGYGEDGVKKDFGDINELAEKMEEVFAKGKVTKRAGDRCRITHDGFTIIVSQNVNGERKNWVITAVDYNRSEKEKGITANPPLASHGAEGEQSSHVTPRNPERKGTKEGNTAQEKGGKNEGKITTPSNSGASAVNQVNLESLVGALRKNGEAKLSDHSSPLTQGEEGDSTGVRFRETDTDTVAEAVDKSVGAAAQSMAASLGADLEIASSPEEVTDPEARRAIEQGRHVTGWYDQKTRYTTSP